jgi:hypothetical protein
MKQQDNCSPSKPNSTTKDPETCVKEDLLNNEFHKSIIKMINGFKEERQKLVFDLKEDENKQLNELKEYTNR